MSENIDIAFKFAQAPSVPVEKPLTFDEVMREIEEIPVEAAAAAQGMSIRVKLILMTSVVGFNLWAFKRWADMYFGN